MKPDVFSEALLATARIACCVSLLGCGPKVAPTPSADPADPFTETGVEMSAVTQAKFNTCVTQVADYFSAHPVSNDTVEDLAGAVPADTLACCNTLIANTEIGDSPEGTRDCCAVTGSMDGMCYPWGPPRPPESSAAAVEARDRAVQVRLAARGLGQGAVLDLREAARAAAPLVPPAPGLLREIAVTTWTGRMINEHESHHVFLALAQRLAAAGVSDDVVAQCREFADEERQHGVLCGAVVEALGGTALAHSPDAGQMPIPAEVGALEGVLRDLLSICCLSETVAVALIGAERLEMPEGALKELLTRIYADECGHAHFGWRLLPTLLPDDDAMKQRLSDYLAHALTHLEAHELAHVPDRAAPVGGAALGLCSGGDARRLLYATIEQVILPGLSAHGLDATAAWQNRHLTAAPHAAEA